MNLDEDYIQSMGAWHAERDASLRRENGWLALAGLFWLQPGVNTVGSDPGCDIQLPDRAPKQLGRFEFDENTVKLFVGAGGKVEVNGKQVREAVLKSDREEEPDHITLDDLCMIVLQRAKGTGIRLWDNRRPARREMPPRAWFPVNADYRVAAKYTRFPEPRTVQMPDIFGDMVDDHMDGEVEFEIHDNSYKLVVAELPDRGLYIQFSDKTNGIGTYPSGRYLYTEPHDAGRVIIDFNKAYSPPCAFTPFATCSFSPRENRLDAQIQAGEIYKGHE